MTPFGLTERGFIAKTFPVILEEEREAWKAAFGYDIGTSTDTPEGAYIGNLAIKITQLWEVIEGLWAIGDTDSAHGVYLDRLLSLIDVERRGAQPTRVFAALWGDEGTRVIAGHLTKMISGEQFALLQSVTINRNRLLGFTLKVIEVSIGTYNLVIDGTVINHNVTEELTKKEILQGIFESIQKVFPGAFAAEFLEDDEIEIRFLNGINPFALYTGDQKLEITSLGALGIYRASIPGPTFCGIGTLNRIVTNVRGLHKVINYSAGITGRLKESDTELRLAKVNRQVLASANELAIQNAVERVAGVLFCRVFSNRTMYHANGRPPKSFEAIVIGGLEEEIAEAILHKGPAGIEPFGNKFVEIRDQEGTPWKIGFSRPENRYLWLRITIVKSSEEDFPRNGIELMKDNIVKWGLRNLRIGRAFKYQRLHDSIHAVSGILHARVEVTATDTLQPPEESTYAIQNIKMNERQIALIDKTRIKIDEKPIAEIDDEDGGDDE